VVNEREASFSQGGGGKAKVLYLESKGPPKDWGGRWPFRRRTPKTLVRQIELEPSKGLKKGALGGKIPTKICLIDRKRDMMKKAGVPLKSYPHRGGEGRSPADRKKGNTLGKRVETKRLPLTGASGCCMAPERRRLTTWETPLQKASSGRPAKTWRSRVFLRVIGKQNEIEQNSFLAQKMRIRGGDNDELKTRMLTGSYGGGGRKEEGEEDERSLTRMAVFFTE